MSVTLASFSTTAVGEHVSGLLGNCIVSCIVPILGVTAFQAGIDIFHRRSWFPQLLSAVSQAGFERIFADHVVV